MTRLESLTRRIVLILHERGREVTADEVSEWLDFVVRRLQKKDNQIVSAERVAACLVIGKSKTLTMALHLRFGDALG